MCNAPAGTETGPRTFFGNSSLGLTVFTNTRRYGYSRSLISDHLYSLERVLEYLKTKVKIAAESPFHSEHYGVFIY
jgi:hypothetical protein